MKRKTLILAVLAILFVVAVPAGFSVRGSDLPGRAPGRSHVTSKTRTGWQSSFIQPVTLLQPVTKLSVVSRIFSFAVIVGHLTAAQEQVSLILQGCVFLSLGLFLRSRRSSKIQVERSESA